MIIKFLLQVTSYNHGISNKMQQPVKIQVWIPGTERNMDACIYMYLPTCKCRHAFYFHLDSTPELIASKFDSNQVAEVGFHKTEWQQELKHTKNMENRSWDLGQTSNGFGFPIAHKFILRSSPPVTKILLDFFPIFKHLTSDASAMNSSKPPGQEKLRNNKK